MPKTPEERLNEKYVMGDGCWEWTAAKVVGYGRIWWNGKLQLAHRVMYELHVAPIPEGLELDHLCRNPGCVRPDHLEPVTHFENQRRGYWVALKTECPHGHPYIEENIYRNQKTGKRHCRTCSLASGTRSRQRRRAAAMLIE
jgi:hypothetical protein